MLVSRSADHAAEARKAILKDWSTRLEAASLPAA
jgi:hypothetical protein